MSAGVATNVTALHAPSSVVPLRTRVTQDACPAPHAHRIALLGTGTVGRAFVARCGRLRDRLPIPAFATIANSRVVHACGDDPGPALDAALAAPRIGHDVAFDADELVTGDVVVDATASDAVAARHAAWLQRGLHVVTANKLGTGASLARAQAIDAARASTGTRYGDAATVGAGLPLLSSLRALVEGGDRIHAVEGVLSGSLAWLFNRYDGMRPFSGFVHEALAAGYTEPDPRIDLSGEDVRRKLLILARAAGLALQAEDVQVDSLVPSLLAEAHGEGVVALLPSLDGPIRARYQQAWRDGARLRFVGRFAAAASGAVTAQVGLCALPATHPLCGGDGTDNRVAITSDRYRERPLVIQGPGAGAEVTAAALLDDVLRIASSTYP